MKVLSSKELIASVRSHADMQDSSFITDDEILHFLNLAYETLYDIIVDCNVDLYLKNILFKSQNYPMQLPHDFYKLKGLDVMWGRFFYQASSVGFESRQHSQIDFVRNYELAGVTENIRYNLRGNVIKVDGLSRGDEAACILWYYPKPLPIDKGAAIQPGWQRYLIYSACRSCRVKEDSSVKDFYVEMMRARQDVEDFCVRMDWANNSMIQNKDPLYLTDGDYAYFSENSDTDSDMLAKKITLPPSLGIKTQLPEGLNDYQVDSNHVYYIDNDTAVIGMKMPKGLRGRYGSWVAVFMYRESGNVYISQESNPSFDTLDELFISDNQTVEIESKIYTDNKDFFHDKLFYSGSVFYSTSKTKLFDPPVSNDPERASWFIDISWSVDGSFDSSAPNQIVHDGDSAIETLPETANNDYLVIKFFPQAEEQIITGIYFDVGSEVNQISSFTRHEATTEKPFVAFVSNNALDYNRFSNTRVTIKIGGVNAD